jgi:hypothetical protein
MLRNDIRRADAVRHTSVDAGTLTADRADSHGHCPQNRLTCQNTQGRPSWVGEEDAFLQASTHKPATCHGRTPRLDFAGYSPQRQRLIGYGRCVRSPEPGRMRSRKSRTVGFRRARAVETAALAARRVSIVA